MIEFEQNNDFILLGINVTNWVDEEDGNSGTIISIGFLLFNINILF